MTEHYVTLLDQAFLPQGLALHTSLSRHASPFVLWVLCIDNESFEFLRSIRLAGLRPLSLAHHETDALRHASLDRNIGEYCWTLTPFSMLWVLQTDPTVKRITYLDADIYFLASPDQIFREFESSNKSVLITEHDYSPQHDQTATCGRYCVQFLTIKRGSGEEVLRWWSQRCIEWCYSRFENGQFGDQVYLTGFLEHFPDLTMVLSSNGKLLAPWNADYYRYSDAVLYHFHGLRICNSTFIRASKEPLSVPLKKYVYDPYVATLQHLIAQYKLNWIRPQIKLTPKLRLVQLISTLYARLFDLLKTIPTPVVYTRTFTH